MTVQWGRKVVQIESYGCINRMSPYIACISIKKFFYMVFQHSLASPSTKPNSIYFWKLKLISDLTDIGHTQHLHYHYISNFSTRGILTHAPKNECEVQEQCRAPPSGVPLLFDPIWLLLCLHSRW